MEFLTTINSDRDIVYFPLSILTAAALLDGIIAALVLHYQFEQRKAYWGSKVDARRRLRGTIPPSSATLDDRDPSRLFERYLADADSEILKLGAREEIMSVLSISEVSISVLLAFGPVVFVFASKNARIYF